MTIIKRAGPPKKQAGKLLEGQDFYLMTGVYLDAVPHFENEDYEKQMWRVYCKELTEKFCKERPGELPWAWWKYNHPNPDKEFPKDVLRIIGKDHYGHEIRETQFQHLKRMGLLERVKNLGFIEPGEDDRNLEIQKIALKYGKVYKQVR